MIILLLSMFDIYTDAYFSSEFIIFIFFAYVCLTWCNIFWYCSCWVVAHHIFYPGCSLLIHCNIAYHIVLQILLCVFLWHKMYIYYMYEYIYIYVLVCENYIFIDIFDISVNFLHISWWIFSHKCIIFTFQCHISCFFLFVS